MKYTTPKMWKPNVVLMGPAGAKGILYIGALKYLEEEKFLNEVTEWVGISAGAAISLLYLIGYTPKEITEICINVSLLDDVSNINIAKVADSLGLIRGTVLENKLKECMLKKYSFLPNLEELYTLTNKKWTAVTFNMNTMDSEFLCKDTHPDLCAVEATMMSMAVPILIQPRKYKGCTYVDGGISAPYPVLRYDNGVNRILGIYVAESHTDKHPEQEKLPDFLYKLVHAGMISLRNIQKEHCSDNVRHLCLQTNVRDITGISISQEIRYQMISDGHEAARIFYIHSSHPEKYNYTLSDKEEIPMLFDCN